MFIGIKYKMKESESSRSCCMIDKMNTYYLHNYICYTANTRQTFIQCRLNAGPPSATLGQY